jgi:hypothetical protein
MNLVFNKVNSILQNEDIQLELVGKKPVEQRNFCLYGLGSFLKENSVGKKIKAALAITVGIVIVSGAFHFVEKNYDNMLANMQLNAQQNISVNLDNNTLDNFGTSIVDHISQKINHDTVMNDYAKTAGLSDKVIFLDVEDSNQINKVKADMSKKYSGNQNELNKVLGQIDSAVTEALAVDSPFSASNMGESNFFTIKKSSNYVLETIMGSLKENYGDKIVADVLDAEGHHEMQHIITHNSVTSVTKAIAKGEISQNNLDQMVGSKYMAPILKDALKNLKLPNEISKADNDLYKKVNETKSADTQQEADTFYKVIKGMGENMKAIELEVTKIQKTDTYVQHEEMLSDAYGSLIKLQQGHTQTLKAMIEMRTNGINEFHDNTHDTRAVLKFMQDNVTKEMLSGLNPADLSSLGAKVVDHVKYGEELNLIKEVKDLKSSHALDKTSVSNDNSTDKSTVFNTGFFNTKRVEEMRQKLLVPKQETSLNIPKRM